MTNPNRLAEGRPVRQGLAIGTTLVAAALLLVAGIVALLQGIAALAENNVFVAGINYTYRFDLTTWGWIHIVLGTIAVVVSLGLLGGMVWARGMAFVIAALSIVANFLWMLYYPVWAIVIIALDVAVIWAVATWRPEVD
ncbi:hypothetical protein ACKAMS_32955 [Rhodococcus sp. 5A-K4]|uniref:DUF7144 family membrane protein n=1 Tax=Rhodococcus sp. 5A-K4 TaxID=3384442 RepID=UPI0038D3899A